MVIIPKEKIKEISPSTIFLSRWSVVSLILLGILALSYGGIFLYKNFLFGKVEEVKNQIQALDEESKSLENTKKEIITVNNQIINLKNLLDNHLYWSRFFEELEKTTLVQVAFSDFSADINKGEISMKGFTSTYGALARQIVSFKEHLNISQVTVSNISLGSQGVNFSINIKFDKEILNK